ncbi:hypothetical protein ACTA71_011285 [Dictyostelium dimigraforme]
MNKVKNVNYRNFVIVIIQQLIRAMMVNQVFNPLTFALGDTDLNVELTVIHAMFAQTIVTLKILFIFKPPIDNFKDCYNSFWPITTKKCIDKCSIVGCKSPTSTCKYVFAKITMIWMDFLLIGEVNSDPLRCSISGAESSKAITLNVMIKIIVLEPACSNKSIENWISLNNNIFCCVSTDLHKYSQVIN